MFNEASLMYPKPYRAILVFEFFLLKISGLMMI